MSARDHVSSMPLKTVASGEMLLYARASATLDNPHKPRDGGVLPLPITSSIDCNRLNTQPKEDKMGLQVET